MRIDEPRTDTRVDDIKKGRYYVMETKAIDTALQQMRLMTLAAQGKQEAAYVNQPQGDFATILQDSINRVNTEQKASHALAQSFEAGENTNIEEVMISLQKASLSFQEMVQVRNKLVAAYNEIMNLTV